MRLESLSRLSRLLLGGDAGPDPNVEDDTEDVAMAGTAYTCSVLPDPLDWAAEGTWRRSLPIVSYRFSQSLPPPLTGVGSCWRAALPGGREFGIRTFGYKARISVCRPSRQ